MSSLLYTVPFGSQVYGLTNSKSDKDYNLDLIVDTFILNVYSLESKKKKKRA